MNFEEFAKKLYACFEENGISNLLDDDKTTKFYQLANILVEANKKTNLTAITDKSDIIYKHFADCAKLCEYIQNNKSVIDVGCGAGFPSLPLAILRPDLKITSLDSTAKKIAFVKSTARQLNCDNIEAISARAEEFVQNNREKFDYATSRAVARLNVLCELCIPLVKVGGMFVPLKASKAQEELQEALTAISCTSGVLVEANEYVLNRCEETLERCIFKIEKVEPTSPKYPRKYAQIIKKPL